MHSHPTHIRCHPRGFTLIELLVVIAIIGSLAAIAMVGVPRFIDKGKKVTALSQINDLKIGFASFEAENGNRPLLPTKRRNLGLDTVYGNKGGEYSTAILVAVLGGKTENPVPAVAEVDVRDYCRTEGKFMAFKPTDKQANGVGPDGVLYDPWGQPWMVAVNAKNGPNERLLDYNETTPGKNDRFMDTGGLAIYADSAPRDEDFVIWTYGKDGKMGSGESVTKGKNKLPLLNGSDDVASW